MDSFAEAISVITNVKVQKMLRVKLIISVGVEKELQLECLNHDLTTVAATVRIPHLNKFLLVLSVIPLKRVSDYSI